MNSIKQKCVPVCGCIREHLQVVRRVLVVRCSVQCPYPLQQRLRQTVGGEEGVSIDQIQVTVSGGWHDVHHTS